MNLSHMKKGSYCSFVVRAYKKKAIHRTLYAFFIIISLRASEVTITAGRK